MRVRACVRACVRECACVCVRICLCARARLCLSPPLPRFADILTTLVADSTNYAAFPSGTPTEVQSDVIDVEPVLGGLICSN